MLTISIFVNIAGVVVDNLAVNNIPKTVIHVHGNRV